MNIQRTNNNLFKVSEKNNIQIPYSVGLVSKDSIIYSKKFKSYYNFSLPDINYDYAVINPSVKLPELKRNNNYIYRSSVKPLRIRLIGDIDDPKKRNIYLRPEVTYNLYDGISPGINFLNKGFKNKPFYVKFLLSMLQENNSWSMNLRYRLNNEIKDNFSTIYNLFYNYKSFNENLRYQVFSPSITFNLEIIII